MKCKWSKGQIILGACLLLSLIGSGYFFLKARQSQKRFDQWERDKPIDFAVDFSRPGEYTAAFIQTCSSSHSEMVGLTVPTNAASIGSNLLNGLSADLEIIDRKTSNAIVRAGAEDLAREFEDGLVPVFYISPFPRGEYVAKIHVTSGATNLNGMPQRLQGRYLLCGLENLPTFISKDFAICCLVLAGVFGIILVIIRYRQKRKLIRAQMSACSG